MKVGINGFGRIGRCLARILLSDKKYDDLDLVQINASGTKDDSIHLMKYDSVHGRFYPRHSDINRIHWTQERDINNIEWKDVGIVFECTGAFNDGNISKMHLNNGAEKVIISAPAKNVDRTVVYGVNHTDILPTDNIISSASCTTNCLAPIVKVLDETVHIIAGQMTTIHSYTGDQSTVDKRHKDPYRARAGAVSMVPTSTGAAKALQLVLPHVAGKIKGSSIRVPTPNVSCVDLTVQVGREVDSDTINTIFKLSSENGMKDIIGYEEDPCVSIDFNTTRESAIFAPAQTRVTDNHLVRILAWYDNEWAFSHRMADTAGCLCLQ
tara:strand:+ start:84 stop:1055 length:972 start_codon:yes stop_codon:yes gene_type:complete